jgi:hypothetical protein
MRCKKLPDITVDDLQLAITLLSGGDEAVLEREERPGYTPGARAYMPRSGHTVRSAKGDHAALAKLAAVLASSQLYKTDRH